MSQKKDVYYSFLFYLALCSLIRAETGSGKTLAYCIPILQQLSNITPPIKRGDGAFGIVSFY